MDDDHQSGASEHNIRTVFQRFMETAGIAAASEMSTEVRSGQGKPGRRKTRKKGPLRPQRNQLQFRRGHPCCGQLVAQCTTGLRQSTRDRGNDTTAPYRNQGGRYRSIAL